jgi:hypothetical protein
MSEKNTSIEFPNIYTNDFELKDIKSLLSNFENTELWGPQLTKEYFAKLDSKDNDLSDLEELLFEKYNLIKEKSSVISFLSVIVNKLEGKTKKEQNNEKLEDFKNRLLKEFREKQFEGFEKRYDNMYETLKVNTNPFNDISYEKIMGPSQIDDKSIDEIKDLIKNITDEKVLFKTLELYKNKYPEEAEKWLDFNGMVNSEFTNDLNILKKFFNLNNKKPFDSYIDIKDIDIKKLKDNEKIDLLKMLDHPAFNLLLENFNLIGFNTKDITDICILEKIKNYETEILNSDDDFYRTLQKEDESFLTILKNFDNGSISEEEMWEIVVFDISEMLPKSFSIILSSNKLIDYFIKQKCDIYDYLDVKTQKIHTKVYVQMALASKISKFGGDLMNSALEKDYLLSKIPFSDVKSVVEVFTMIDSYDTSEVLKKKLLKRPRFISNLKWLLINSKDQLSKYEGNKVIEDLMERFKIFWKNVDKIKKIEVNSNKSIENIWDLNFSWYEEGNKSIQSLVENMYKKIENLPKNAETKGLLISYLTIVLYNLKNSKDTNTDDIIKLLIDNWVSQDHFSIILEAKNKLVNDYVKNHRNEESEGIITDPILKEKIQKLGWLSVEWWLDSQSVQVAFNLFRTNSISTYKSETTGKYLLRNDSWEEINADSDEWRKVIYKAFLKANDITDSETSERIIKIIVLNSEVEKSKNELKNYKKYYEAIKSWNTKNIEQNIKSSDSKTFNDINKRGTENPNYSLDIESLPSEVTDNNSIIVNWETINNITKKEYDQFKIEDGKVGCIDAFKNFIDVKEKLNILWINFAWEKRNDLIPVMKTIAPFDKIDRNFGDSNLLTKDWFNNYLKFLIKIAGEDYSKSNIADNYSKIREINNDSVLWEKKDNKSGFWPFWHKLVEKWIFNGEWTFDYNNEGALRKIFEK